MIIIKREQMPENCFQCVCMGHDVCYGENDYQCNITLETFGYDFDGARPDNCPLQYILDDISLIDADALAKRFVPKQAYFTESIIEKIDNQERIVKEARP